MGSFNQEQELEAFRQEWRKEVQEKKEHVAHIPSTSSSTTTAAKKDILTAQQPVADKELEGQQEEQVKEEHIAKSAMDHYVNGVENEREGKLGKALNDYRRAFKLDPNIDYAYKKHYQEHILPSIQSKTQPLAPEHHFKHVVPIGNEFVAPPAADANREDPLRHLIDQFLGEDDLGYIPRLEYKTTAIAKLPNEIMLHVVRYIALHSISTIPFLALTCKKFFLYSRDPTVWQYACTSVFKEPYMTLEDSKVFQAAYVKKYNGNWMRMFVDRPRIRFDGVYISTCHYIRPGTSETGWNQPVHLVTYYRYLRFFPNGTILKHLTTNEPSHVVRNLERHFNKQQSFHGTFKLNDNDHTLEVAMTDHNLPTEDFRMSLNIKTTHQGRHNKLNWIEYYSIPSRVDRDVYQFDLKLFKPYFFSPVRSYKVDYAEYDADYRDIINGVGAL
ncbi:hypothetical protein K501DRAFT_233488 [Backusella circina FSU 941]|nr:hypothetical protein K501DRAFT_233488 [Backusella circina FSU 941]